MSAILEYIPLSSEEDLPRFFEFFEKKIKEGEIDDYTKKFKATKSKVRSIDTELTKEESKVKMNELTAAIMNNANKRQDHFASMMARYGGGNALCIEEGKLSAPKEKASGISSKSKKVTSQKVAATKKTKK